VAGIAKEAASRSPEAHNPASNPVASLRAQDGDRHQVQRRMQRRLLQLEDFRDAVSTGIPGKAALPESNPKSGCKSSVDYVELMVQLTSYNRREQHLTFEVTNSMPFPS
jgi:hypothetical protein